MKYIEKWETLLCMQTTTSKSKEKESERKRKREMQKCISTDKEKVCYIKVVSLLNRKIGKKKKTQNKPNNKNPA